MSRWRMALILGFIGMPLLILIGIGSYALWQTGYGMWVWLGMTGLMSIGYFLAWYWMRQRVLLGPVDFTPPRHWTERDRKAFELVEKRAQELAQQSMAQLNDLQFYAKFAQQLALDVVQYYHPGAQEPFGTLTVPEVLAVIELAAHDLADLVNQNVPGSHLMTIDRWRWTKQAAEQASTWYRRTRNVWWLAAAVLAPVETGLRYAAAQAGTVMPWQMFQQDLIAWFHTAFAHRLGSYLIDLYSGRLKVGAQRYRELTDTYLGRDGKPTEAVRPVDIVTLTVIGQAKVGKSSFINALLGEQKARTDVLPATDATTRYQLTLAGTRTQLLLLDTVGYGHEGPRADQLDATRQAVQQADVVLLVLHARNPARQADQKILEDLKTWFAARPELRPPPVLAVMTHIDLLSPALEWAPPYNWQQPQRPKEKQMQEALTAVREQLGAYLVGVVPVCTAPGKVYGVAEWFLPVLLELLGQARAVALLRCLHAEADTGKVRRLIEQIMSAGQQLLDVVRHVPPQPQE